ncbi:hypothetical protein [Tautonia plasticadhaerens]|uniref:Uncharacterized protein n=1 Tax=Tautonia plasticadhaerens TaxID=2527974 RepID=A0A518H478_9BACT|nr:hypothetical protein [Tautonia plasticadhaerens]QDV35639.1 hypothetical protein ElP_35430 [Tautonia plasticadhaerens]
MASLKKKLRRLGRPPSRRRSHQPVIPDTDFAFPIPASVALDLPRLQSTWRAWYEAGIVDRPWNLGASLEVLSFLAGEGLIDWTGLEGLKPMVLDVLERVRSGAMRLEEFEAIMDRN